MKTRFDDRVVIVTGAGRGLGREFAVLLADLGARVVVNDIGVSKDAERYASLQGESGRYGGDAFSGDVADSVVAEIGARGGAAVSNTNDVSDAAACADIVAQAVGTFGRIDGVINNAGVVPFAPIEELGIDTLEQTLSVHVGGTFSLAKAAWPHFREQRHGRILNVCSIEGVLVGNASLAAYAAAKGAMMGLTRALASEGRDLGICVNGLLPGATTRGNVSVRVGYRPTTDIDRSPALVAPVAAWLVHEECTESGKFFAATAGSVRPAFMSVGAGYQSPVPAALSIDEVRTNWGTARSHEGSIAPEVAADYNEFRLAIYHRVVDGAGEVVAE